MIVQCLSNKNENVTVSFFQNFLKLNKALFSLRQSSSQGRQRGTYRRHSASMVAHHPQLEKGKRRV